MSYDATAKGVPMDQPVCVKLIYSLHGRTPGIFSFIQRQKSGTETTDRILYQKIGSQGYKFRTAYITLESMEQGAQTDLVIEVSTFPATHGREVVSSGTFSLRLIDIKSGECPYDAERGETFCDFERGLCDYDPNDSKWQIGETIT